MFMIVKKIFDGVADDEVHISLLRNGRGEFSDKFLVDAKKQASKWSVKTGFEYVNTIVRNCLTALDGAETKISGVIVTTLDLKNEITFPVIKIGNFQGVRSIKINDMVNPTLLLDLMDKYPKAFVALTFKTPDFELKVKAKGPKPPKGAKGDEDTKADFLSLKTNNWDMIADLFFDVGKDWKVIKLNHTLKIDNIEYPANLESLKPAEVRELSKRGGTLYRTATLDDNEKKSEVAFLA
ncbi:MAG: hypothetical protein ACI83O_000026 [Patescibacteria group bacterium]|jgi:hypothetical protein